MSITETLRAGLAAADRLRVARADEAAAAEAARQAKRAREHAERELPVAERQAKEALRKLEEAAEPSVTAIEAHLDRARRLEAGLAGDRSDLNLRSLARSFLLGAGDNAAAVLTQLATEDPVAGAFHAAGDAARNLLQRIAEQGLSEELYRRVDDAETQSWRGFMHRARVLSGEVES